MRNHRNQRMIILLRGLIIMTTLFSIPYFTEKQNNDVRAADGTLDLQDWNPGRDGTVALKGQWKFFWKEFVDCGHSDLGGMAVKVPSFWDDYDGIESGFGYGRAVFPGSHTGVYSGQKIFRGF